MTGQSNRIAKNFPRLTLLIAGLILSIHVLKILFFQGRTSLIRRTGPWPRKIRTGPTAQ
jgi:hypothetical protein